MSMSLAESLSGRKAPHANRILLLTLLFWLFSYAFLAMRGAMLEEEWAALLSGRRAIAVTAGAVAYWLVLERLEVSRRIDLAKVAGWIISATIGLMLFRLALDQLFTSEPLPPLRNIRWSLAWSGYFGLWVMGAIAFRRGIALADPQAVATPAASSRSRAQVRESKQQQIDGSDLEWLADAIGPELTSLDPDRRTKIAARLLKSAGYELAEENDPWAARHNARVQLAERIAARLLEAERR
jgi:hypothetical protein